MCVCMGEGGEALKEFRKGSLENLALALAAILFIRAEYGLSNVRRGSSKEHSCEIISKSINWLRRRCLKFFFSIFSSGCHFVHLSGTV